MTAKEVAANPTLPTEVTDAIGRGEVEGLYNGRYWTTENVADNDISSFFTGKRKLSDAEAEYRAWRRDQESAREAREFEKAQADTAWQRKVADLEKAGFSPLAALDASGQGAAVPTAQVARSSQRSSSHNPTAGLIGAIVGAMAMIASRGASAGVSAKASAELEAVKQSNRLALQAMKDNAAMSRAVLGKAIENKYGEITKRIIKY